jgi:CheY-like chemotaxis protein
MAPRLLVVDDTPEIALIVRRLGRHAGHEVAACGDVAAAWEYLRSTQYPVPGTPTSPSPPDLVLLDVNLPGTPGPDLCRRLRTTPGLAELPVALLAHWDRGGDVAAGLAAGADFVVGKDLVTRPAEWADRLRELLAWPHGRTARRLLSWSQVARLPAPAEGAIQALNPAIRQTLPRHAGAEVLPVLAERALQVVAWWERAARGGDVPPPRPQPLADVPDGWLLPTGLGLDAGRLARARHPEAVVLFAAALVEQIECVVGMAAALPVRAALGDAVPGLAEVLAD